MSKHNQLRKAKQDHQAKEKTLPLSQHKKPFQALTRPQIRYLPTPRCSLLEFDLPTTLII
jgi:hypothetical protein